MQATRVSMEAEMLVRQTLTTQLGWAARAGAIASIALFTHALDPNVVIFGTAEVDGQVTALPETLLKALNALRARQVAAAPWAPGTFKRYRRA